MVAAVPVRYVFRCDMDRDWSFAISFAQEKPTTIFRKTKDFIIRGTWGGPFDIMHITNIVRLSWTLWMSSDLLTCIISQFPIIATLLCTLQLRRLFIWWVWQSIFDDILRKQEKIRVLSGESHVEYLDDLLRIAQRYVQSEGRLWWVLLKKSMMFHCPMPKRQSTEEWDGNHVE
jgi:hypothetical protein